MSTTLSHGDFSTLADDYASYRPDYARSVVDAIVAVARARSGPHIDALDVGAGTGIFTRMLARSGVSCVAVEPCAPMREAGQRTTGGTAIEWCEGSAENTRRADDSCDLVTMASSFHWADFEESIDEFARVLRPGGTFVAIWNPRHLESNPLLVEIEQFLRELVPELDRVSSGSSAFTEQLEPRLRADPRVDDVLYLEGQHVIEMSPERYLGAWSSVNDVRVQAGPERFQRFMDYVASRVRDVRSIEAAYRTRAWVALMAE